jgi:integral membrane protein
VTSTISAPASTSRFTPRRLYRVLAVAEAVTWTLLISGMILKYGFGVVPEAATVAGFMHGTIFIAYGAASILVAMNQRWGVKLTVLAVISAVVPYATIPFEMSVDRKGLLAGAWRLAGTDHPKDQTPIDRLFRWFLNRPVMFGAVLVLAVAAVLAILLIVGPPGGSHN